MPDSTNTAAFTYPTSHVRRHGPGGYRDYASYRPWLRDEFTFRCAYCLKREHWGQVSGEFDLDHFVPQSCGKQSALDYGNLIYVCHTCNLRKGDRELVDTVATLISDNVRVYPDGSIEGLTDEAERMIRHMSLNSRKLQQWRRMWIRIIQLAEQHDAEHYRELMGFPDLSACNPPSNSKPEGITQSYFAKRERGELDETYLA